MSRIPDRITVQRSPHRTGRVFFIPLMLFTLCLCDPYTSLQAQCPQNIDLTSWSQEGYPSNGLWTVQSGGAAVVQSLNGPPTYFVSPYELINVRITGKITVDANAWDNDNIGFVFGYNAPIGVDSSLHDFWLFDWKKTQQNFQGYFASEGYHLSHVDGRIYYSFAEVHRYFWNHETNPPLFEPVDSLVGGGRGWRPGRTYTFSLTYTTLHLEIRIDNSLIFQRDGCFSPGRFGFYNYSQEDVTYADFEYTLISDFTASETMICPGGTVDFTAVNSSCSTTPTNITSWKWDFGDGTTSTNINPSHTFTTPGTYPVTLKITDVNNCVDSVTQNVTVSTGPLVDAGTDAHICPLGSQLIGMNASGGVPPYSYSWSPAGSLSSATIAQPAASPSTTTTYTLTVTDAMGCSNADDVTVFVEPAPTADAGTDQVNCGTEPVVIGMPGTGGTPPYTYAWNPPIYLSDPNIMQPTARPTATMTYTVTVTDANGCTDQDEVTVMVQEKPFAAVGPDRIVCAGDSIMIGEEAIGGTPPYTYAWTPAQFLSATDIAQPMAFPAATTTYTLTVTDANGCSDDAAVTITVVTLPPLTISGLTSVCPQTTWSYRSGLDASVQHTWRIEPPSAGTITGGQGTSTVDVSWNNAGTAYVVLEIEAAGCSALDSIQVNISGELSFRINNRLADTLGFCPGASLTLDAGDGFTFYEWEPGGSNARRITVTQPGTYQVTVRDASGCSGSDTVHVVAFQPPRPVIDPSATQTICRGDSVTLNVPGSYTSIRWSTGDTTQNIRVSASDSYTVTVTDENGCEGTSPPTIVTVSDPEAPDITGDTVACLNAVRNYSVRNPAAGSFTWEIDASQGTIVTSTETSISVRWTRKGTVSVIVTWTDAASPCTASDTLLVLVGDGLAPVVIGEQAICEGDTALLRVSGGPYESIEWLLNGVPVTGGSDSTLAAIAPGTYTVRVASGDCSGESLGHVLTLIATPTPSIAVNGSLFLCEGDSLQLTVPGSYSGVRWSTGERTPSIFIHQAGSYSVTVDSLGCSGVSEEIVVRRAEFPDTVITGPAVACINTLNTYSLPDRTEFTYAWSVTGGQLQSGQGTSRVEVAWSDSTGGIIEVTVTHRSSGCSQVLRLAVTISRTLRPRITPAGSVTICRGASVVLRTEAGYQTYQWKRNGSTLSGTQTDSLVVTEDGDYVVDVTDNGGCSGVSDPVRVTLRDARIPLITADRVEFCLGESATCTASTGYRSYAWLRDGQPTGDTTRILTVTPTSGGTYRYAVTVIDSAGCSAVSADLAVTALPVETPRLSVSGSQVVCDPEGSTYRYSWYINDTLVRGATSDRITIERTGRYRVVITDDNGCSAWSEPLPVTAQRASAVIGLACTQTGPVPIGGTVVIPLNLLSSANLDAQGIHSLEARVRYDWSVLAPAFPTRDEITEGAERVVTVDAQRPEFRTLGTLLELPFTTMLGGTDCAPLRLDSAWWSDGSVQTELNASDCNICVDVCREGGTRLYYAQGELSLAQNRPNPFNASTVIEYEIIEQGPTSLYILDKVGRRIATLAEGVFAPGRYVVSFTATELPSGSYVCVLQTPSTAVFRLMILVK